MLTKGCSRLISYGMARSKLSITPPGLFSSKIKRSYIFTKQSPWILNKKDSKNEEDEDEDENEDEPKKQPTYKERFYGFWGDPKRAGKFLAILAATSLGLLSSEKFRDILGIEFGFYNEISLGVTCVYTPGTRTSVEREINYRNKGNNHHGQL